MAKSRKLPPLTLEEAHTPGHIGMMSFLEVSPDEARLRMINREEVSAGVLRALPVPRPVDLPAVSDTPVVPSTSVVSGTPAVPRTPVKPDTPVVLGGEAGRKVVLRVRACRVAQDGHSVVEQSIYDSMYRHPKARPEADGSRIVALGYADLSYLSRISRRSVRLNVRSLLEKMAIEVCGDFSATDQAPKTYRVLSYATILDRRRAKGLEYIVRRNGGVQFVNAEGGELSPVCHPLSLPSSGPVLVPEKSPMDEPSTLGDMLSPVMEMDTAARRELILACRAESPSARVEEIARIATEMAAKDGGRARNLVGYLLTVVPRQFEGKGIAQSRGRWAAEDRAAEQAAADQAQRSTESIAFVEREVQRLREIETDTGASAADRLEAAKLLKQLGR